MGGRQSSQSNTAASNTSISSTPARVPVQESRNSTGTSASSSNVDVTRTDQPRSEPRRDASVNSLRVGRSSRPTSSYAEGARSVRERVRLLPNPTTYSSSAPATNPHIEIGLLLALREVSLASKRIRCPSCQRRVALGALEDHLASCSEPKLSYNVSELDHNAGECVICLEDMLIGDRIARLPCLCIYHQKCIENWLTIKQSCPEHPTTT